MASGAQLVVAALERAGVEVVFGLPGVHNLALWPALEESPIRVVGVRHEQAAAYAADGYARATGEVGVALVTTGPGAANTLGAVGEAWASRSPVVVIATDVPSTLRREGVHRGLLHEVPRQGAMFDPVTKETVRAEDVTSLDLLVGGALREARRPPARPVYVEIPTDLLNREVEAEERVIEDKFEVAATHELDQVGALMKRARRPLLWVGGGALDDGEHVAKLAEALAAPVVTTYSARGVLPPEHPCLVGLPPHMPEVGALWDEADLVIAIGSDLDGMMTQNWAQPAPPTLIAINVDSQDASKNYQPDVMLEGPALMARGLAGVVTQRDGLEQLSETLAALRAAARERMGEDFAEELAFVDAFAAAVPDDATVVCDMCIPGYWLGGFAPVPGPRRLAYPMGWGTLGWAFPAAIGSALGGPGPAVAVCGDGGFLFACGELATVAQERPPLTALIVNDGGYGMLRYDYARTGAKPLGVDLTTPDFVALAESFGVQAEAVDGLGDDFSAALARHVQDVEPSVLVANAALQPPPTTSPRWYRRS